VFGVFSFAHVGAQIAARPVQLRGTQHPEPYSELPLARCPPLFRAHVDEYAAWHSSMTRDMRSAASSMSPNAAPLTPSVPIVVFRCRRRDDCGGWSDISIAAPAVFAVYGLRSRALIYFDVPSMEADVYPSTFDWSYKTHAPWLSRYVGGDAAGSIAMKGHDGCEPAAQASFPCFYAVKTTYNVLDAAPFPRRVSFVSSNRGYLTANQWGEASYYSPFRLNTKVDLSDVDTVLRSTVGLTLGDWGCLYRAVFWPSLGVRARLAAPLADLSKARAVLCGVVSAASDAQRGPPPDSQCTESH